MQNKKRKLITDSWVRKMGKKEANLKTVPIREHRKKTQKKSECSARFLGNGKLGGGERAEKKYAVRRLNPGAVVDLKKLEKKQWFKTQPKGKT